MLKFSLYIKGLMVFLIFIPLNSCSQVSRNEDVQEERSIEEQVNLIIEEGNTIKDRFRSPLGYSRVSLGRNSFGEYLRNLPLKPSNAQVRYYDGTIKTRESIYCAVFDLPIGNRDLHQCADAIIRLRADYLRKNNRINDIHFEFTNGFQADYSKWINGNRIQVTGNNVQWVSGGKKNNSDVEYWKYLEMVFSYAGTLSLSRELQLVQISEVQVGDVFIQGGSPGHAVIVVDLAVNDKTGQKIMMLAQSYMPAQEIQILLNPLKEENPWFEVKEGSLLTPEWKFNSSDLKRFEQ